MNTIVGGIANWKTSLAGISAAVAHVTVNGVGWKQLLVASGFAVWGWLSKDHDGV